MIGLWLLIGRALRGAIYLLALELVGILSPIILLGDRLFSGPRHAPTLQGQYVLKDIILVAAVLVIAATVRRGRLTDVKHGEDVTSRAPEHAEPHGKDTAAGARHRSDGRCCSSGDDSLNETPALWSCEAPSGIVGGDEAYWEDTPARAVSA